MDFIMLEKGDPFEGIKFAKGTILWFLAVDMWPRQGRCKRTGGALAAAPGPPAPDSATSPWSGTSFYGRRGRINTRELWEQMNTCSCLNLILACIVYWQAWKISRVFSECRNPLSTGMFARYRH